ncbi:uncharacterized protein C24H6.02c [Lycium barbarum]|uniref:uncharacterized protein C24H6.02c n=1 Tax=Lycium barbarum TaxID=112863 RepID=UPI00293E064F|nr:uncharacterized protein C24H6.02c [Lycium barbarum]XP_060208029.1 uncharacterized protein C24H6.02c [Lycium barbarum]XP_060208030.1 uncharacterized protein C24H6.02c [Lycium barbarum]
MAARQIQRRILSLLSSNNPQTYISKGLPRSFVSPARSSFATDKICSGRCFQTVAEITEKAVEVGESNKKCDSDANTDSAAAVVSSIKKETTYEYTVQSNLKISPRHDLMMVFTCKVCETRTMKTVCRESYEKGVVVARCDGCKNIHLIADRLGWFGEPGSVEDFLAARGEEVKKGCTDTLGFTLEDLAGKKNLEAIGEK